jgi:hypothetical protein
VTCSSSDERTTRLVSASRNVPGPGEGAAIELLEQVIAWDGKSWEMP